MSERPVILNSEEVKATLENKKTQMRRPVDFGSFLNNSKYFLENYKFKEMFFDDFPRKMQGNVAIFNTISVKKGNKGEFTEWIKCPFGKIGDSLWVKETWKPEWNFDEDINTKFRAVRYSGYYNSSKIVSYANRKQWKHYYEKHCYLPSIYMPRWASRITLEITDIRVERVQDISLLNAYNEGLSFKWDEGWTGCIPLKESLFYDGNMLSAWVNLWDSKYSKKYPWSSNPWVWVLGVKLLEGK